MYINYLNHFMYVKDMRENTEEKYIISYYISKSDTRVYEI